MKYALTLFTLFVWQQIFSQNINTYKRDSAKISNCALNTIQLPTKLSNSSPGSALTLPFQNFIVRDVRSDTTTIGVQIKTAAFAKDHYYRKLLFDKPASVLFSDYVNNNTSFTKTNSSLSLLGFIKEFRIVQSDSLNKGNSELYNKVFFNAEAFLSKDSIYYPAMRLDTVILSLIDNKDEFETITDAWDAFIKKAASIDSQKIFVRTAYKLSDLETRYRQRFDKPILTAKQLNAGIYKSFSEFLNNQPSVVKYKLQEDKKATTLYSLTPNNEWLPETKAYGFCDGNIVWLNIDNVFHPLIRKENTFEFLGDYYSINYRYRKGSYAQVPLLSDPYTSSPGQMGTGIGVSSIISAALNHNRYASLKGRIVHQLNMEDGEFY